jgi:membrane protease YdiL (CAAX protease family)
MWLALVALAVFGCVLSAPFMLPVLRQMLAGKHLPVPFPVLLGLQGLQVLALASLAAFAGVWASPKVGVDAPLIRARLGGQRVGMRLLGLVPDAVLAGTVCAAAVLLLSLAMKARLPSGVGAFPPMSPWRTASAAFYGGLVEEILFRWGFLTLLAYLFGRLGLGRGAAFVAANVAAAAAFAASHLPAALALGMQLTPVVVSYLLVANGAVALVFGWLFRRHGLESAMLAHGSTDLWLHSVFPVLGL